ADRDPRRSAARMRAPAIVIASHAGFAYGHAAGVRASSMLHCGSHDIAALPERKDSGRMAMLTLYSMRRSGNSYKVRLALAQLQLPYRLVEVDILKGESHTPEFLTKNPNGQVPLLEVEPDRYLAESNAILWHLASGTRLRPEDRFDRAEALQWL